MAPILGSPNISTTLFIAKKGTHIKIRMRLSCQVFTTDFASSEFEMNWKSPHCKKFITSIKNTQVQQSDCWIQQHWFHTSRRKFTQHGCDILMDISVLSHGKQRPLLYNIWFGMRRINVVVISSRQGNMAKCSKLTHSSFRGAGCIKWIVLQGKM